ncbi:GNAT family N-acetyltransferase [Polaribacter sp. KT 15]|uniref:GNAT family N-acetyltransferase n=1 Tax=Polaribacter sp. KT 15 TaxID=1896175 RepID=UPI00090C7495|nr:GNAT family N-acetyltransferase [Polaribacter sp. KT 15]SHM97487.1 Acetyltransferase (GNAT) domain-containing protein [Polaribacter sp. KT 15]
MIVKAVISDAEKLSEIAMQSKAVWGYSNDGLETWREDLTITPKIFDENYICKYVLDSKIVGFYVLNNSNLDVYILEFLFIDPNYIEKGIGHELLLNAIAISKKAKRLQVLSDPNAEAFYTKYGFKVIDNIKSSIPGRLLPKMELQLR